MRCEVLLVHVLKDLRMVDTVLLWLLGGFSRRMGDCGLHTRMGIPLLVVHMMRRRRH